MQNKINLKKYTYDEFGMYANDKPIRPIICLLFSMVRIISGLFISLFGAVILPFGIIFMLSGSFLFYRGLNMFSIFRNYMKTRKSMGQYIPKSHTIRNIVTVGVVFFLFLVIGISIKNDSSNNKSSTDSKVLKNEAASSDIVKQKRESETKPTTIPSTTEQQTTSEQPTADQSPETKEQATTETPTTIPVPTTEQITEPATPAPTEPPTEKPAPAPTEPQTEVIRQQPQTEQITEPQTEAPAEQEQYVYLTKSGSKYHSIPNCGNTDTKSVKKVPLSEAKKKHQPCSICCPNG